MTRTPEQVTPVPFSYVLPLRWTSANCPREELASYLRRLSTWCPDVIVVDGSPEIIRQANRRAFTSSATVRHLPVDPRHRCLMGKVAGVMTGLEAARHDRVVIGDDDVRYEPGNLARVVELLGAHDVVRPQNYFSPLPWHAAWDTARSLLNRATLGADFPGTLGVRRGVLLGLRGYDGDVLFENLELIRTVLAGGGSVGSPLDLYVLRLPPSSGHFWGQRTRQAYDDFAMPARMAVWLSVVPALAGATLAAVAGAADRRRVAAATVAAAGAVVAVAESGRRRAGGRQVFPAIASALAPLWVLERGACAWLAVLQRVRYGGVRYGDSVIPVAAHSVAELRDRLLPSDGSSPQRSREVEAEPQAALN